MSVLRGEITKGVTCAKGRDVMVGIVPSGASNVPIQQQQGGRGGVRPQAAGKMYAISKVEASRIGNLVCRECMMFGRSLNIFFYSKATHSFTSKVCERFEFNNQKVVV